MQTERAERALTVEELERQTARQLDALRRELRETGSLGDTGSHEIDVVGRAHFDRLLREATITDFIPLLVYRLTKEEFVYTTRDELHDAA